LNVREADMNHGYTAEGVMEKVSDKMADIAMTTRDVLTRNRVLRMLSKLLRGK
jgi:hypothetical protein